MKSHSSSSLLGRLLALFWCHGRPGGPPYGSDADALARALAEVGLEPSIWQPASASAPGRQGQSRDNEWLGLWHKPHSQQARSSGS